MAEASVPLSATALRMAGHVGQTALGRVASSGVAAVAEVDQHMAAVREELAASRPPTAAAAPRAICPEVPFVSDAAQAEVTVPIRLLLHYASGFVEAAIRDDWWPADSADATDWVSLRLAAICLLITQAEAAAGLHPDLRASA